MNVTPCLSPGVAGQGRGLSWGCSSCDGFPGESGLEGCERVTGIRCGQGLSGATSHPKRCGSLEKVWGRGGMGGSP